MTFTFSQKTARVWFDDTYPLNQWHVLSGKISVSPLEQFIKHHFGSADMCSVQWGHDLCCSGATGRTMGQNTRQPRTKAEGSSGEYTGHEKWLLHGKCQLLMRVMTHRVITTKCFSFFLSIFVYTLSFHQTTDIMGIRVAEVKHSMRSPHPPHLRPVGGPVEVSSRQHGLHRRGQDQVRHERLVRPSAESWKWFCLARSTKPI